jgi:putative transposase
MSQAFATLLNAAMLAEREATLGAAPYERSDSRRGHANGFKPKTILTRAGPVELRVPKARGIEFYPQSLEKGIRSEKALKLAVAEMYVQGVSTRKVREVPCSGGRPSAAQRSPAPRSAASPRISTRSSPSGATGPSAPSPIVILDARYEKVRHGSSVVDCAVLVAIGVRDDGKRTVLGVSSALSEAEPPN